MRCLAVSDTTCVKVGNDNVLQVPKLAGGGADERHNAVDVGIRVGIVYIRFICRCLTTTSEEQSNVVECLVYSAY